MENCWLDKNGRCLEEVPDGYYGFVYLIRVERSLSVPRELWDKVYVGKKAFTYKRKKVMSKKARKGTRKRVEIKEVDSRWKSYWGSSKELIADIKTYGQENFKRIILDYARNKTELSYLEVYYQIWHKVLHAPSYNGWISCKIFKKHL